MARSKAPAIVGVKIFEKKHEIAPVRVALELAGVSVHGPASLAIAQEDSNQSPFQLDADLLQIHPSARARRTFHAEIAAQEAVELPKGLDNQEIDRKPDGAAPV
jgi:hypothetical protein